MITVELSRAQAAGLLELADRAAEPGAPPEGMGGKRFIAANRAIDRLRDALAGHEPGELHVEIDAVADALDDLHDPDIIARLRARFRDMGEAVRLLSRVEQMRRRALLENHGRAVRRADMALKLAREEHVGWRTVAVEFLAACEGGMPEHFGPLSPDVFDLFELDYFELGLRGLPQRRGY